MMASPAIADALIREARSWVGTPYMHQASQKGVGCDCLGLVRGVWRSLYGFEPEKPPAYTPDWSEMTGGDTLPAAAMRHCQRLAPEGIRPGDLLLFRMRRQGPVKHCGLLSSETTMIHAWSGHAVAEVPFDTPWQRRLEAVFRFPAL